MSAFPSDEVLIERGRYATVAAERRALLKALRDDMEAITEIARRVMRSLPEQYENAAVEILRAKDHILKADQRMFALCAVEGQLDELRPLAWAKEKQDE